MAEPHSRSASGNVMSIETGFSCNAFCGFCPQLNYRGELSAEIKPDLSTAEIRERIQYGARNGYKQIGFSGGEPTIREDIIELVGYARGLGYELIGMTTNGMRMSYMPFLAAIVRAGLNCINLSVNGPNAKLHDAMMRTPGSFDQAMAALDNIESLRRRARMRIDTMSMSLAAPQVVHLFPEIVRLTGSKGVRVHMLQPFLLTKGNTHLADRFLSSYADIEHAIREGARVAEEHGGHVKLFNTPVCRFPDIESKLERQQRKLEVFREHEQTDAGESRLPTTQRARQTPQGFYRIDACATCDESCNGFRVEYYPQEKMVAEVVEGIDRHVDRTGPGTLWLGGLELLSTDSKRQVLERARSRGASRIVLLSGGIGRGYHEQFDEGIQQLVDEICFVALPRRLDVTGLTDRHLAHGNLDDIEQGVERLRQLAARDPGRLSATFEAIDALRAPEMVERLWAMGIRRLVVGQSRIQGDTRAFYQLPEGVALLEKLAARGFDLTLVRDARAPEGPFPLVDVNASYVEHRWNSREAEWIAWSIPPWRFDPDGDVVHRIGVRPPAPAAPPSV